MSEPLKKIVLSPIVTSEIWRDSIKFYNTCWEKKWLRRPYKQKLKHVADIYTKEKHYVSSENKPADFNEQTQTA